MIGKLTSLAILAAAGATFSAGAIAAPINVDIRIAPPAARYEVVPGPRAGYVWTPGYWDWRSNRHYWVAGNWVAQRPGYIYTQPTWVNNGNNWYLYRGAWARGYGDRDGDGVPNRYDRNDGRYRAYGDRDRDGVPNRYDRYDNRGRPYGDRDRDGVANRNDRDRDGDGTRNRNDRRPDNPNRR